MGGRPRGMAARMAVLHDLCHAHTEASCPCAGRYAGGCRPLQVVQRTQQQQMADSYPIVRCTGTNLVILFTSACCDGGLVCPFCQTQTIVKEQLARLPWTRWAAIVQRACGRAASMGATQPPYSLGDRSSWRQGTGYGRNACCGTPTSSPAPPTTVGWTSWPHPGHGRLVLDEGCPSLPMSP